VFHLGSVNGIDLQEKVIDLDGEQLRYDYLILALGSKTDFYAIPSLKESAFQLKELQDTERIREHIERMFAGAKSEGRIESRGSMLRFVIGGGGLTGIELATELSERRNELCREYEFETSDVEIILIEMGERVLPTLDKELAGKTEITLSEKGVKILTKTKVVRMIDHQVTIQPGNPVDTHTMIWTRGIRISNLIRKSGLEVGLQGRVIVNEHLEVKGFPGVFAVGDNALAISPVTGKPVPTAAQFALQQGRLVANNIHAECIGKSKKA
jgi:NADH dehydrogenase